MPDMTPRTTIAKQSAAMALIAGAGCTASTDWREFQQMPAPPALSTAPTSSAASVSIRPWPYGWFSSGGLAAATSPSSTTVEASTSPANSTPSCEHGCGLRQQADDDVQDRERNAGKDARQRDAPGGLHLRSAALASQTDYGGWTLYYVHARGVSPVFQEGALHERLDFRTDILDGCRALAGRARRPAGAGRGAGEDGEGRRRHRPIQSRAAGRLRLGEGVSRRSSRSAAAPRR